MENLIPIILLYSILVTTSSSPSSIYDIMKSNELPPGLFPTGITNFTIDPATNHFTAYLNHSCSAKFETDVHYHNNISGTVRHGEIVDLSGVSAQDLFLWFNVKSIRVDIPTSGIVHFDVGVVRKQFSLSMFEEPPECIVSEDDPVVTITDSVSLSLSRHRKQVKTIESEHEDRVTVLRSAA